MSGCIKQEDERIFLLGKIISHDASNQTGFRWFSYVPESIDKAYPVYILIDASYEGVCDSEKAAENALNQSINRFKEYAEMHKYVLLCPAIYKNCNSDVDEWVRHFPEYVLTDSSNFEFYRIDLKINAMIDELSDQLQNAGYNVMSKVFLIGFSIGGHFANRYALLQPNRVKAFAIGGLSGEFTLPEKFYQEYPMNWTMGINNFETLVGKSFQAGVYKQIRQFIFWGENDHFPYHLSEKCGWGISGYCHWVEIWGNNSAEALRNQCVFLQDLEYNITFKEYPNVGHEWTYQMLEDTFTFFEQFR